METKPRSLAIAVACMPESTAFTLDFLAKIGESEFELESAENGFLIRFRRFYIGLYEKDGVLYFKSSELMIEKDEPVQAVKAARSLYNNVLNLLARRQEAREGGGQ